MKKLLIALLLFAVVPAVFAGCGSANNASNTPAQTLETIAERSADPSNEPSAEKSSVLTVQEQGNFSVGGTVTTSEGKFDPMQPWMVSQGG
jgi:hypothetical protein